jgi:6-phosphogluconate dehydrogenase
MGGNMLTRLRRAGIDVTGYDRHSEHRDVTSLPDLVAALPTPRNVWVMVPHGAPTQSVVDELATLLEPGDLVIEGGNSRFTSDIENAKMLGEKGIGYLDCGVSGGIWGLDNGYGLMVGGEKELVERVMPVSSTTSTAVSRLGPVAPSSAPGSWTSWSRRSRTTRA